MYQHGHRSSKPFLQFRAGTLPQRLKTHHPLLVNSFALVAISTEKFDLMAELANYTWKATHHPPPLTALPLRIDSIVVVSKEEGCGIKIEYRGV